MLCRSTLKYTVICARLESRFVHLAHSKGFCDGDCNSHLPVVFEALEHTSEAG
jgi:hypothetical protein